MKNLCPYKQPHSQRGYIYFPLFEEEGKNRCDIVITVLGVGCYKIENTKLL